MSHIQQNGDFRDHDAFELVYNVKCLYNLLTLPSKRFLYVCLLLFFIQGLFITATVGFFRNEATEAKTGKNTNAMFSVFT